MKNIHQILLLLCFLSLIIPQKSFGYQIRTYTPVYNGNSNIYAGNLNRVERYLFGKTFLNQSINSRFNRIENRIFNNTYPTIDFAKRMNNILANYKNEYNYSNPTSLKTRLFNTFIGQPTGFTPQINSANFNSFSPSYSGGYYGTNGYRIRNVYSPLSSGTSINILD